jgi:hypothetical protein
LPFFGLCFALALKALYERIQLRSSTGATYFSAIFIVLLLFVSATQIASGSQRNAAQEDPTALVKIPEESGSLLLYDYVPIANHFLGDICTALEFGNGFAGGTITGELRRKCPRTRLMSLDGVESFNSWGRTIRAERTEPEFWCEELDSLSTTVTAIYIISPAQKDVPQFVTTTVKSQGAGWVVRKIESTTCALAPKKRDFKPRIGREQRLIEENEIIKKIILRWPLKYSANLN